MQLAHPYDENYQSDDPFWGQELEFNGVVWKPTPGVRYKTNYYSLLRDLHKVPKGVSRSDWDRQVFRWACLNDLWFLCFFALKIPETVANNRFWVRSAWELDVGPQSHTLDIWAREHGKSTMITVAKSIQDLLRDPNQRIGIFSYSKPAAVRFCRNIKWILEESSFLKTLFPDVLYDNPSGQAPMWSDAEGLVVKRKSFAREPSISGHGLLEGMPTGSHFTGRMYDDVEVKDFVGSPDVMGKLCEAFDMSKNLGTLDGWERVTGTHYHHQALLSRLRERKDENGNPAYYLRLKPATIDGTPNGASVYLPEKRLVELRTNRVMFFSQQLLDPTPLGEESLNPELLEDISPSLIPPNVYKFMMVDPAGHRQSDSRDGDSWGIIVVGVEPCISELGLSEVYILDACIEPMQEAEAIDTICRMYIRNGRIMRLGVEKVSLSAVEQHVANALRARGRVISIESGTLVPLRPGGRSKKERILQNLQWPLNNSKLKISTAVPKAYRERLKVEMQKFPFWHDDGIDSLSYVYDLLQGFRFSQRPIHDKPSQPKDLWERMGKTDDDNGELKWMLV